MQTLPVPVVSQTAPALAPPRQATHDAELISMWLHRRPENTRRPYERHVGNFLRLVGRPLGHVTVGDLQDFADTLTYQAPRSRNQALSAVKSLLTYGQTLGYLAFNVGAVVKLEKIANDLAQRILSEDEVQGMLHGEKHQRNHAILRLLYAGGLRVSELVDLKWRDLQDRDDAGQVTVFGKGGKTRHVLLSVATWRKLMDLRNGGDMDAPVFRSTRGGGHMCVSAIWRIVRKAARRAGIEGDVSPHWLRHAHASHALERGAPMALVRDSMGHSSVSTTNGYLHARPNDSSALYLAV
jgi:integrase/recombinase XerD